MSENPVKVIYLGIGSNLGNRKKNIEMTKFKLVANNVEIIKTSSYYESLSWPNQNNPKFINIIVKVKTRYTPLELIQKCQNIEKEMGRKKSPKNPQRVCDIDRIDYKKKEINRGLILINL